MATTITWLLVALFGQLRKENQNSFTQQQRETRADSTRCTATCRMRRVRTRRSRRRARERRDQKRINLELAGALQALARSNTRQEGVNREQDGLTQRQQRLLGATLFLKHS